MVVNLNETQQLVSLWDQAKKELERATLAERIARDKLVSTLFPELVEGAGNKVDIGFGKELQVTHKINRTLDPAVFNEIRATLPADVVDATVTFKPTLIVKAWKSLPASARELIAPAVTEKIGAPGVEIVAKKKPGA